MAAIKNVLIITTDHHRFDGFGFQGNPLARTPNLDRLAESSVRFTQCYSQSPVCQPARFSIVSGRYVHSHGVTFNELGPPAADFRTIGHVVEPVGYRRFNVGHMHWSDTEGDEPASFDTGFERWVSRADWRKTQSPEVLERFDWEIQRISRLTTGGPSPRTKDQYWGYQVAQETVRGITEAVARDEPFLAFASIWEPHPPFYPPADMYRSIDQSEITLPTPPAGSTGAEQATPASSGAPPTGPHPKVLAKREKWTHLSDVELRQMIAGYYGMVALADGYVGMILDAVESLGIRDETLIVFTSDHGDQLWDHELFLKFVFYEESVHVPLFFSHPSLSPCDRDGLVEHVDILPTLCELLGLDSPTPVQGRSLVDALHGGVPPRRDAVFSEIWNDAMIRTAEMKLNLYDGEPWELYDLVEDPREYRNVIADPRHQASVARLKALYADRLAKTEATR